MHCPGIILIAKLVLCLCIFACSGNSQEGTVPVHVDLKVSDLVGDPGNAKVILSWSPLPAASSYTVYYCTKDRLSKFNATRVTGVHSPITIRYLTNDTSCLFSVAAVSHSGEGPLSKVISVTPKAIPPPAAPTNVQAVAGKESVSIFWDAVSGATSYSIYMATASGVAKESGTIIPAVVSPVTVSNLVNGTKYYFVLTARSGNGESKESFEVTATPGDLTPPERPQDVVAESGNSSANISWPEVAGASGYNLYWLADYPITKTTGTKVANVVSPFTISDLANKTSYFFMVTSVNGHGESAASAIVSATPLSVRPEQGLVLIPAGQFQMGDSLDSISYAKPVHTVHVSAFYIERYETTYEDWQTVYKWALQHGYQFDSFGRNGSMNIGTSMPVTYTSWYDATKWLNARSEKEGRTPCYYTDSTRAAVYKTGKVDLSDAMVRWDADGYRLPTDAEWEKAARGGVAGKRYPWGDDPADPLLIDPSLANYKGGRTTTVGVYPANGYGLHDMTGNVWEWTWDWFATGYFAENAGVTTIDPHGPAASADFTRIRKGGSYEFGYGPQMLRCADKMSRVPTYLGPYFGFRAVSIMP